MTDRPSRLGEHQIDDRDVVGLLPHALERGLAVDGHIHRKTGLARTPSHEFSDRGIVFNDQGAHRSPYLLPVAGTVPSIAR
jgi:hypothetical protein